MQGASERLEVLRLTFWEALFGILPVLSSLPHERDARAYIVLSSPRCLVFMQTTDSEG